MGTEVDNCTYEKHLMLEGNGHDGGGNDRADSAAA